MRKQKPIELSEYTNLWKTQKALDEESVEDKLKRKEIIKIYGHKTKKKPNKIGWRDLADRVHSEYVRLYYADKNGYCICFTSGEKIFWTKIQNGHFVSRGVMKYRYDIENCHPQSYRDNVLLNGNYKVYTVKMIEKYGIDKVNSMINDKETFSPSQKRYEKNILERYEFIKLRKESIEENVQKIELDEF